MREADLQAKILDLIRSRPGWWAVKYHQDGRYASAGTPDILACYQGHFVAMEVKRPGEKPTRLQQVVLRRIAQAGGTAVVVASIDSAQAVMLDIARGKR